MEEINQTQKDKLKKVLGVLGSQEDVDISDTLELNKEIVKKLNGIGKALTELLKKDNKSFESEMLSVLKAIEKSKDNFARMTEASKEALSESFGELAKKLDGLGSALKPTPQKDYAPTLQNIVKGLADMGGSLKGWKWPQYLYSGLRDRTFTPINPATDGIGLGTFDFIQASYPDSVTEVYTFKTNGIDGPTVGVVTVVYTSAAKALVDTVTKTPVSI